MSEPPSVHACITMRNGMAKTWSMVIPAKYSVFDCIWKSLPSTDANGSLLMPIGTVGWGYNDVGDAAGIK